jgi:8-oxo-dGTP pyrophosphatase MutT (NUDIX family)
MADGNDPRPPVTPPLAPPPPPPAAPGAAETPGDDAGRPSRPRSRRRGKKHQRRLATSFRHSAGGVLMRNEQILLIVSKSGHWRLPKGRLEKGETSVEAAIRETREETGVMGTPRGTLPGIEYVYIERGRKRIHKKVDFYLMDWVSGEPVDFDRTEVKDAAWFSWDESLRKLWFENERIVVRRARELAQEAPPPAQPAVELP